MTCDWGAALRRARLEAGLTLRGLADRMQLSPATISAIENGKTGVSASRLLAFADALGVPAESLLATADTAFARTARPAAFAEAPTGSTAWRRFPPLDLDPALAAAIDAFVETGYHGSSMRDIAKRAGMSVPGIYHHYPEKQHLLVRALDITMGELHWRVAAARSEATNGADEVGRIVEALALFHTHRRKLAFIGASEMRSLNEPNRARIAELRNDIQYAIDEAIDRAVAENRWATAEPRAIGRAIATMCTSLPQWFRDDGPSTPEHIAHTYAGFALALLRDDGTV